MQNKKKIIFLVSNLSLGGLENYLLRFIKVNNEYFSKIIINCKQGKGGTLEYDFNKIENVQISYLKLPYANLFDYIRFYRFLKKERFDTICDFTGTFSAPALLAGRISGIKKRITFYRDSAYQFKMTFLKKAYVNLLKFFLGLRQAQNTVQFKTCFKCLSTKLGKR